MDGNGSDVAGRCVGGEVSDGSLCGSCDFWRLTYEVAVSPRQDQRDRFVLIQKPYVSVVWGYAPKTFLYHATEDGLRSVCRARTVLDDADAPECFDRSSDIIACSAVHRHGAAYRRPHRGTREGS